VVRARWLIAVCVLAALCVSAAAPAGARVNAATLDLIGFATVFGDGKHTPRAQAGSDGRITTCKDRRALAAIFRIGGIPALSRYSQRWTLSGRTVYAGKESTLDSSIATPITVYMSFRKPRPLKNGKYTFQFVLDGQPHVLGSVIRACRARPAR
jgi:hypothetical protein